MTRFTIPVCVVALLGFASPVAAELPDAATLLADLGFGHRQAAGFVIYNLERAVRKPVQPVDLAEENELRVKTLHRLLGPEGTPSLLRRRLEIPPENRFSLPKLGGRVVDGSETHRGPSLAKVVEQFLQGDLGRPAARDSRWTRA